MSNLVATDHMAIYIFKLKIQFLILTGYTLSTE